jgi:hypothetical protein
MVIGNSLLFSPLWMSSAAKTCSLEYQELRAAASTNRNELDLSGSAPWFQDPAH